MSEDTTKAQRGQFFTVNQRVQDQMIKLLQTSKRGTILEPSSGEGHLVKALEDQGYTNLHAVEFDPDLKVVSNTGHTRASFFDYAADKANQFDCIFGNPPYVAWKNLEASQLESGTLLAAKKGYGDKTNLYYLFMDRCIDLLVEGGEMIFIVPKEWLYTSSAHPLREKMLTNGHITHVIDCGEEKLFPDADVPSIVIFRFQKNTTIEGTSRNVRYATTLDNAVHDFWEDKVIQKSGDRLLFLSEDTAKMISGWGIVGDFFSVKVGIVSGADPIFRISQPELFEEETLRAYLTTKGIEWFIDVNHITEEILIPPKTLAYLRNHKPRLISRKIAKFSEGNWWRYGAIRNESSMESDAERFYVWAKTRSTEPFFENNETPYYSGGILGLFLKAGVKLPEGMSLSDCVELLNSKPYRSLFDSMQLTTANKLSLQPSTLEQIPFPKNK